MPVLATLNKARVPVKIWAPMEEVESSALDQLARIGDLPFVFKHVAAMPDVHLGIGATVGSVVATKGAVVPAAVGVDIGCGMVAMRLPGVTPAHLEGKLAELRHSIERSVPVGPQSNREADSAAGRWVGWGSFGELHEKVQGLARRALLQMGTLGGGNHFIEVCVDSENCVWIMLHSGSRNIGKSLAEAHINTAKGMMKRLFIDLADKDLAYFAQGTSEFKAYIRDLLWAQDYAMQNREIMAKRVLKDVRHALCMMNLEPDLIVNCHHNFAEFENHFGENVLVTRKGAVRARQGDMGIIPGSMGTRSYIVRGKGNPESFMSCSHGAGRRMSRSEARRRFTTDDVAKQTFGVECRKDDGVVDEIPAAYKDIDRVMEHQSDLVEVVAVLKQILCVKG